MSGFIALLLGNKFLVGAIGMIVTGIGLYAKGVLTGAKKERAKTMAKDLKAAEDRLEMDREATAAERQAAGMTDDEARAEALKWARH